jgi:DNA-binding transcriptional MocR family regulator
MGRPRIEAGPGAGWTPDLRRWGRPRYLAIVEAIAEDVRTGRLAVGERLPPQRLLAQRIGLDFTTVARGYVAAQARGLIESRVGQGTFVLDPARPAAAARRGPVDFSMNLPPEPDDPRLQARMQAGLTAVAADLGNLLRYQGFGGTDADKAAALVWLQRRRVPASPDRLLLCPGAHSALDAVLATLTAPGDTLCAETLTYPGIRAIAAHRSLRLIGLPLDRDGVDPEAFAAACAAHAPKVLYLNPLLQNPTTQTLGRERRDALAAVARRFGVAILEDDAYGFVAPDPPPAFSEIAPDLSYHVAGLAKCLGAGLRLAYLVAPSARSALALASTLRASTVMASPVTAALATRWITDGTGDALLAFVRTESRARQRLAAQHLPSELVRADPDGFHLWLSLPAGWTRAAFASQGRAAGLGVVGSDAFCAEGAAPEAVRICLGGMASRADIARALEILGHALTRSPTVSGAYI